MKGKQNTQPGVVVAPRPQSQNARGSTPPQQRGQDDFQARSPHAIQFQPPIQHMMAGQPNMQHQPQTFQRPPRIQGSAQFFPPSVRPISIRPSHPSPQQNPMYQSPPTGTQMMPFVSPQGQPTFIPQQQQYVQQQNEFTTTPVVSGQIQFRPVVPQQVAGQFAPVPSPAFSQQQAPYGMQQTIYTQPQPYYAIFKAPTPVPQQQPPRPTEPKREKKIIRIKDPNQDNRDVTQEILMAGTQSGSGTPNSTPDASGRSSSSSTPPVNLHNDAGAQFAMQVAATLDNDKPASNKSSQLASKASSVAVTVDQVQQNSESKLIETSRGLVEVKVKQVVVPPSEIAVEKRTQQSQAVVSQTKSKEALLGENYKCLSEELTYQNEHEELYRQVTSILNKLTPQTFQTSIYQILLLEIDTLEKLEGVVETIFEKAMSEPDFSAVCACMCKCLMEIKVRFHIEDEEGKALKEGLVSFRTILLKKCQMEFEKKKSEESLKQAIMDVFTLQELTELKRAELEEEESKMRRRSLGNIRFIGELFKLNMMAENIMHDCVVKLLRSDDKESYECLCVLLSTIGKDLDHKRAKARVDQYFDEINKIIHSRGTSSRVRFMMIDVVDLRKNNWVPKGEDNNTKIIDQFRKEVQEYEKKTTMMIQQAKMQKRESGRGGRDNPRNVGSPQVDNG